jgi:hypothetical protein
MLITNFGDLKAALSRYMFHSRFVPDYDLATSNFEKAANRRLRVRQMETVTPLTTVAGEVALPPDYLLWRTVFDARGDEMDYVHPAYMRNAYSGPPPAVFTIEGQMFKTNPVDDTPGAYEFHYYQKIPTITGANTDSNWLLTEYPDAYEYGAVTELHTLGRNREEAELWKARRDEVLVEIIQLSALTTGATSSKVRVSGEYF